MIGLILQSRAAVAVLLLAGAPVWCGCPMLMGAAEAAAPSGQTSPCGGGCGSERDRPENPTDPCDCDHPVPEQMVTLGGKQGAAELERPGPAPAWAAWGHPTIFATEPAPASRLDTSPPRGDPSLLSLHTMLTT